MSSCSDLPGHDVVANHGEAYSDVSRLWTWQARLAHFSAGALKGVGARAWSYGAESRVAVRTAARHGRPFGLLLISDAAPACTAGDETAKWTAWARGAASLGSDAERRATVSGESRIECFYLHATCMPGHGHARCCLASRIRIFALDCNSH